MNTTFHFLLCAALILSLLRLSSGDLRLQACDEDFRQMANWLCTRPKEQSPCFKYYFEVEMWKTNFTQETLLEFGKTCCQETGCLIGDLKQHCCLESRCVHFCYAS
ncbi:hypothetical protein M3Y94_00109200 [Aphelenchoides besseyi]|nr:hypothetical protein M3Y94_00109200 [Aphelenchoides besseyi]